MDLDRRYEGKIAKYNRERGYGFVQSNKIAEPVWFHFSYIRNGDRSKLYYDLMTRLDTLSLEISFRIRKSERGLQAYDITLTSQFSEIEEFLKDMSSNADTRKHFIELLSLDAIDYISDDPSLAQKASIMVGSYEAWESLATLARHSKAILKLLGETSSSTSHLDSKSLAPFVSILTQCLGLEASGAYETSGNRPLITQAIVNPKSPLRCFRQADTITLVIVPYRNALLRILREEFRTVQFEKTNARLVVLLEDKKELVDTVENLKVSQHINIALFDLRTIIELVVEKDTNRLNRLGAVLRRILPLHRLQPYEVGAAYNQAVFTGRIQEKMKIIDEIDSNHAVYGGRKIGKSWFLKDMQHTCLSLAHLSDTYYPIYVSLQGATSSENAAELICDAVKYVVGFDMIIDETKSSLAWMYTILLKLHQQERKTIFLLLDEVDDVLKAPNNYEFFSKLRQIQHTYPKAFKYVFAGFKELIQSFSDEVSNNTFGNWIGKNHFSLGCLGQAELQKLVVQPLKAIGFEFGDKDMTDKVFELTSGHPYYVQSLCYSLVEKHGETPLGKVSTNHVEKLATEEFFEDVFDIFELNLSPLQKLIGTLFSDKSDAFNEDDIVKQIRERFKIELSRELIRQEMKILQACSVFRRVPEGYEPVMRRINQEFFLRQDDSELALAYLDGIQKHE